MLRLLLLGSIVVIVEQSAECDIMNDITGSNNVHNKKKTTAEKKSERRINLLAIWKRTNDCSEEKKKNRIASTFMRGP